MSCAAIITSLQLYVYLSLRQSVQYVEYYGRIFAPNHIKLHLCQVDWDEKMKTPESIRTVFFVA